MPNVIGAHLLGRIQKSDDAMHQPDALLANHPAIAGLGPETLPHHTLWQPGVILDQGDSPKCTAYADRAHVNCAPHAHADLGPPPDQIYAEEKQVDGLPPNTEGSTTQAAALILQRHGLIHPPLFVHEEWTVRKWVLTQGPVQVGMNWYESMFWPDAQGITHIPDDLPNMFDENGNPLGNFVAGGHEWLIIGYDYYGFGLIPPIPGRGAPLYKCQNSWGTGWAAGGFFYIPRADLTRLFSEDGDGFAAQNWDGVTPLPPTP